MNLLARLICHCQPSEAELDLKFDFLENINDDENGLTNNDDNENERRHSKVVEIVSNLSALQRNAELGEIFEDFHAQKDKETSDAGAEKDQDERKANIDDEIDYLELIDS